MGCCLALAYVVALVRRGWFALAPGRPAAAVSFAPPARRPAPGGAVLVMERPAPVLPAGSPSPARRAGRALVAGGLGWFAVGLVGMHVLGWFAWAGTSLLLDTAFHSSGLWAAAAGLALLVVRR